MDGILLIDKGIGISSFGVLARLRRHLPPGKIGHGGTLDPLATGLLLVLLGRATKLSAELAAGNKIYEAIIRLGYSTATDDREGNFLCGGHFPRVGEEDILRALPEFLGRQMQTPPQFCAKKIGGVAAYKFARKGLRRDLPAGEIRIHSLRPLAWSAPLLHLEISCSKGTYVRSLARDLGERLRCPAHLHALRRTGIGEFSVRDAGTLSALENLLQSAPSDFSSWLSNGKHATDHFNPRLKSISNRFTGSTDSAKGKLIMFKNINNPPAI
ncbi:MAG: tRNA pseudouridine(55) synthase TruB [Puniceicoccales bacterium]|nr:tRNA pseudouridine(55) synthase TruB [Puniceicoccales bacterium]